MGPESKDAVIRTLGHLIDELLGQRHALQEIKTLLEKHKADAAEDTMQVNRRILDVERSHLRLKNRVDGLPQTPAE